MDKHTIAVEPESAVPAAVRERVLCERWCSYFLRLQRPSSWELVGGKTCNKWERKVALLLIES